MKLLTVQHEKVLEIINNEDIYKADKELCRYYHNTPGCYNELIKRLNNETPIFAWYKLCGVSELDFSKKTIDLAGGKGIDKGIWMLLEVPDDLVLLSDFYDYVDMMFLEREGPDDFKDLPTWESVFEYIDKENRDIQAIIPYIKKEWIIETYDRSAND